MSAKTKAPPPPKYPKGYGHLLVRLKGRKRPKWWPDHKLWRIVLRHGRLPIVLGFSTWDEASAPEKDDNAFPVAGTPSSSARLYTRLRALADSWNLNYHEDDRDPDWEFAFSVVDREGKVHLFPFDPW